MFFLLRDQYIFRTMYDMTVRTSGRIDFTMVNSKALDFILLLGQTNTYFHTDLACSNINFSSISSPISENFLAVACVRYASKCLCVLSYELDTMHCFISATVLSFLHFL